VFSINQKSHLEIRDHLIACRDSFVPALNFYVDIYDYSEKLFCKSTRLEIADNGQLVALAAIYVNDLEKTAYLTNFSVVPEYQGCGIAGLLLTKCKQYVTERENRLIKLEVFNANHKAVSFYRKNGFVKIQEYDSKTIMQWIAL